MDLHDYAIGAQGVSANHLRNVRGRSIFVGDLLPCTISPGPLAFFMREGGGPHSFELPG